MVSPANPRTLGQKLHAIGGIDIFVRDHTAVFAHVCQGSHVIWALIAGVAVGCSIRQFAVHAVIP